MNRLFLMMCLLFMLFITSAWAASSQYPDPNRQTMWNNITDSMHTMGQTPQQAKLNKIKLHAARAQTRLDNINQAARAQRQAQIQAWRNTQ